MNASEKAPVRPQKALERSAQENLASRVSTALPGALRGFSALRSASRYEGECSQPLPPFLLFRAGWAARHKGRIARNGIPRKWNP